MSENTSEPAPTTMVAAPRPAPRRSRPADAARCPLHRATLEPTSTGPWWPSTPSLSGERCAVCDEIDRLLAEGRLPF